MHKTIRLWTVFMAYGATLFAAPNVRDVNCPKESLAEAIAKAEPGDTLRILGNCRERVVIATDRIVIDGLGTAVLDGGGTTGAAEPVILIDGARGVTIRGVTIRNGPIGILAQAHAAFKMQNTTVQDNEDGLAVVEGSNIEISDSIIRNNPDAGMGVINDSVAVFKGSVKFFNNGEGLGASASSVLDVRGAALEVTNSTGAGIFLSGSTLTTGNADLAAGSSITANNNGGDGIFLGGSQLVIGASSPPADRLITAGNNVGSGINLAGFASIVNLGAGRFVLKGNAVGLTVGTESSVLSVGGFDVQNNGTGLLADGAGSLVLVSIPPNPAAFQSNTTADADLRFGTRITVSGAGFGKLVCDATVLSRGTTKCP